MTRSDDEVTVREALASWDSGLVAGDAAVIGGLFAEDGQLHWNYRESIVGREAVTEAFDELFAAVDASAWEADHHTIRVHDGHAYVMSSFTETLLPRDGSQARRIFGRAIYFWHREADGSWVIDHVVSARSAPDEPVN